ncbi:hypothetical protein M407DRAFT_31863 [Tulasnella calospora MUT 4182]|uniref:Uncharacterized protein n=1 Tax=Tulasnella calospora MUT 4182 TaxID=1051891 RepID=A0A0C3KAM6_9AGAM|nr:hypothetical protein M407DRAFT_31863 [Tulasnella calospora MUT 4182]
MDSMDAIERYKVTNFFPDDSPQSTAHSPRTPCSVQPSTNRDKTPVFQANMYFGQLERAFVIRLEPSEALQTADIVSLILMDVNMCDASTDRYGFWEYDKFRYREVINGTTIWALVGRMRDREKWVFVQRLGAIEHASFVI